jgi:glycosyltransferase involved in cell wall biosynthesis
LAMFHINSEIFRNLIPTKSNRPWPLNKRSFMHLSYFSNERIPGASACSIQQINMCDAFASTGLDVTLVRPYYFELARISDNSIREYYDVGNQFHIKTLPTLLSLSKPVKGRRIERKNMIPFIGGSSMLLASWYYCFRQLISGQFNQRTIIYSRNVNATTVFLYLRRHWLKNKPVSIFFEVHSLEQQRPKKFFLQTLRECDGLVAITSALKTALVNKLNISRDRIFVAPDGVKTSRVTEVSQSREKARLRLDIPSRYEKIVLYSGQLLPGKGVDIFIEAASQFEERVMFLIVGGTPEQIEHLQKSGPTDRLKNVHFAGFVQPRNIPLYQAAADVFVLPNTANSLISDFTSPLKLFEYMAAGRPIVSSDLQPLQEILTHRENAFLFPAGDAEALASGFRYVLKSDRFAQKISRQAQMDVREYTWEKRAQNIYDFILGKINETRNRRAL